MSGRYLAKLSRWIPLWKRSIPKYPLWYKGNPQLREFLPLFWMKMIKPVQNMPPSKLMFEVHPQMTKYDVQNYLENIYSVKVMAVRTNLTKGEERKDPDKGHIIEPEDPKRIAFVTLAKGYEFEFPDIFKDTMTEEGKAAKDYDTIRKRSDNAKHTNWNVSDVPDFFR